MNENYEFIKFKVPLNIKMCDTHQWISLNLKEIWQLYEISPPLGVDGGEMNFSGYVGQITLHNPLTVSYECA